MITTHSYAIEKMPALWLLPFVSTVVASALAGTVGPHMESRHKELYVPRGVAETRPAAARQPRRLTSWATSCGAWA